MFSNFYIFLFFIYKALTILLCFVIFISFYFYHVIILA